MKANFKMIALILLTGIGLLSSCRTRQEQAQHLLKRAIEKDPQIIQKTTTDTTITGIVNVYDTVTIARTENDVLLNFDSLKTALSETEGGVVNKEGNRSAMIYADSAKSLEVYKKGDKLYARISTPADTITKYIRAPYKVEVKTPSKTIIQYQDKPAYLYMWFWIMLSLILIKLWFLIGRLFLNKPDYIGDAIKRKDGDTN